MIGDVKGKTAVIVDDIIDTGGTLSAAAQTVLDEGAERVFAVATHGVFSGNAFENLGSGPLERDRRDRHDPAARGRAGQRSPCSPAPTSSTDSIRRIFTDDSVSEIFAGENQLFWQPRRAPARPGRLAGCRRRTTTRGRSGTSCGSRQLASTASTPVSMRRPISSFAGRFSRRISR